MLYIDNRFPVTAFKILLAKNKNSPSIWKVKQPCVLEYYQNARILKRGTYHLRINYVFSNINAKDEHYYKHIAKCYFTM